MALNPNVRRSRLTVMGVAVVGSWIAGSLLAQSSSSFTPPARGWLLVAASDYRNQAGRILIVDPAAGTVTGEIAAGIEPDIVTARHGRHAYLSYNTANGSVLATIDLTSGVETARVTDTVPWPSHGQAYKPRIMLSADERLLFRYKIDNSVTGSMHFLQTFDTDRNQLLPNRTPVPQCGPAILLGSPEANSLYVSCSQTQDVRMLSFTNTGPSPIGTPKRVHGTRADLGGEQRVVLLSPARDELTVIKMDGGFVRIDIGSGQVLRTGAVDAPARGLDLGSDLQRVSGNAPAPAEDWLAGRQVWSQAPTLSPDESRLYMLTASGRDTRGVPDQIEVLSTDSLERLHRIELSRPCVSITLSLDGSELYAVDIQGSSVLVLDAATGREKRTIVGVGPRPIYAVVVP